MDSGRPKESISSFFSATSSGSNAFMQMIITTARIRNEPLVGSHVPPSTRNGWGIDVNTSTGEGKLTKSDGVLEQITCNRFRV